MDADGSGNASFSTTFGAVFGSYVSATATGAGPDGFTSEFSAYVSITGGSNTVPVPTVSSLSQSFGSSGGGNTITVTGTGFTTASGVLFGGESVSSFTVNSSTSITAYAPPESAGTVDVIVSSISGNSAPVSGDRYQFVAAPAPVVTGLGTSSGTTAGGTTVVVNGTGFTGASDVFFGSVEAASFSVNSDNQLITVAPAQYAGTDDVTVVTPSGTSSVSSSDQFTYSNATIPAVTSLSLNAGTTAGGADVTINGSYFTGAIGVSFGAYSADDFTVLNDGSITATAPAQASGTVDVTVTTYSGTSTLTTNDHFTYSNASSPTVTGLSITGDSTLGGTPVTITGANFTGATSVSFGSVSAPFFVNSDTSITGYDPAQAAGSVNVTVTTFAATSTSTATFTYSAASAPAVTSLGTMTGNTAGGTLVQINGSGFTDVADVLFGGAEATDITVNSDTQITAVSPPNYAGTWDVQVVTPVGISAPASGDQFSYTLASVPSVTSLATTSGSTAGGTNITLTGTNFTGATNVFFGSVEAADFTVNSTTSLTAIAPPQAAGTIDVTVATFAGSSATSSSDHFTYNAASAPTVTALATTSGSTAGGTLVGITGTDFTGASGVTFGGIAASFTVNSATSITAYAPSEAAATVDVQVTTPSGTSTTSSSDHFTYSAASAPSVTALDTTTGTTAGGTVVNLTGSGFTGATAVTFGFGGFIQPAASFVVNSDTSITAVSPMLLAATANITVTTPSGTSTTGSANQFTYTNVTAAAPAVTGVSPNTGSKAGGEIATITGTNFTGASNVAFGTSGTSLFTVNSDTSITVTVPSNASLGPPPTVDVKVTTNNGTSSAVTADHFVYQSAAAPAVTSLSPTSGSTAGGTSVGITGTNFTSATAVTFGGVAAASFTVNSATSITATSPPLPAGTIDVQVTTPSGPSALGSSDHFTYTAASLPTVTSLGTTTGTTAGGTSVSITGTNFTGATGVACGRVPAAGVTLKSSTAITATSPSAYAGTWDITVSTYAGTSAVNSGDQFAYTLATTPAVTSLGTSAGTTAGGTSVAITGTNLTAATGVSFGNVPAASFTVNSSTSITAIAPAQAARELGRGSWRVKRFRQDAASQQVVLKKYQDHAWPARSADPLPQRAGVSRNTRRREVVLGPNKGQIHSCCASTPTAMVGCGGRASHKRSWIRPSIFS